MTVYLKGNVTVSREYLKECSGDSQKAKELEDFLIKIPERLEFILSVLGYAMERILFMSCSGISSFMPPKARS